MLIDDEKSVQAHYFNDPPELPNQEDLDKLISRLRSNDGDDRKQANSELAELTSRSFREMGQMISFNFEVPSQDEGPTSKIQFEYYRKLKTPKVQNGSFIEQSSSLIIRGDGKNSRGANASVSYEDFMALLKSEVSTDLSSVQFLDALKELIPETQRVKRARWGAAIEKIGSFSLV